MKPLNTYKGILFHKVIKFADKISARSVLRSVLYFMEDMFDKNILEKNKSLKDIHMGQRCFIFGNGVSVNNVDFSLLYNEYTFGVAEINKHKDFHKLNLKFFMFASPLWESEYVYSKSKYLNPYIYSFHDIKNWLINDKPLTRYGFNPFDRWGQADALLSNDTLIFLDATTSKFTEKNQFFENKKVFYFKPFKNFSTVEEVSIDLTRRTSMAQGSIFLMTAIAMYMGFKEIYFIGNDYTLEPSLQFHFYDSPVFSKRLSKDAAVNLINKIANARNIQVYKIVEDEDFYIPIYISQNKNLDAHEVVKKFAESTGVKLFNIVPDGFESPVYNKISWDEVLRKMN